jgi:acetyltransferase-like isoleucine patch superfamily enzyme
LTIDPAFRLADSGRRSQGEADRRGSTDDYMSFRELFSLATILLPWPLRRILLVHVLGYRIDRSAQIGFSLICPARLDMGPGSSIGHLTLCKRGVELLKLDEGATVGNLNWITGVPLKGTTHFKDGKDRHPELIVHDRAAITNRHFIDCTASVSIGRFTIVAGCRSIILSHSIDLVNCRQSSSPISIGEYCFVGAGSVLLPGGVLPDYSVLGANSLLNKVYTEQYFLYAGNPARPVKQLSSEIKYFTRTKAYVD